MITFLGIVAVIQFLALAYLYAIIVDLNDNVDELNKDVAYIFYGDEDECECDYEPFEQLPIVTKPKKKGKKK